jgi:hypothetical protein
VHPRSRRFLGVSLRSQRSFYLLCARFAVYLFFLWLFPQVRSVLDHSPLGWEFHLLSHYRCPTPCSYHISALLPHEMRPWLTHFQPSHSDVVRDEFSSGEPQNKRPSHRHFTLTVLMRNVVGGAQKIFRIVRVEQPPHLSQTSTAVLESNPDAPLRCAPFRPKRKATTGGSGGMTSLLRDLGEPRIVPCLWVSDAPIRGRGGFRDSGALR